MKKLLYTLAIAFLVTNLYSQDKESIKTGWTIGGLPAIAFDSDMGFQYGAILNFLDFGDGSTYPDYNQQIMMEVSRFTKGSGVNQLFYDSKTLLPNNIRFTADLSYLTEKALDFYGFNGYQSAYFGDFSDDTSDDYVSRMFYRHERKLFRFIATLQGKLKGDKLKWLAGITMFDIKTGTVDIASINEGKDEEDLLPDVPTLYDNYVDWGLISEKEKNGGFNNFIKFGLVYDTRDNEPNPGNGLWEEIVFMAAPKFAGNKEFQYSKIEITHRQYFTLIPKHLTFAYRLAYQGTITGEAPFYIQSYMINSFSTATKSDGLGGAKTLRGIFRNRVIGDAVAYANIELRWKFLRTQLLNQNIYMALHAFADAGQVLKEIEMDKSNIPNEVNLADFFDQEKDGVHLSYGMGLRVALNENFILAIDYGIANDKRDGNKGMFISINNLF